MVALDSREHLFAAEARGDLADLWPLRRHVQLLSSVWGGRWVLWLSRLEQCPLEMVGQPGKGEAPAGITACAMDFLLAGAALSCGAGCDVLQWLEKARWFWFGVHQVCPCPALHALHL